jgi:molybdenum cofactor cytidylyltransferase
LIQTDSARIAAIVLAAGESTRMGRPKPLLRLRGETLLARAVRAAREGGCAPVFVIVAGDSSCVSGEAAIRSQARSSGAGVVANPGWSEGVASSIRAGLAAVEGDPSIGGVLVLAVDQPFVEPEDVARLIAGSQGGEAIAAADHGNGIAGIPAIFPRRYFPALGRLRGDSGARGIIESEKAARRVPMASAAIDVDSPEDCRRRGIDAD